jgi:phage shock protein C
MKRLYRSRSKVISGVCGGIADYLGVDPTVVRLIAALGTLITCFTAVLFYIVAWAIMPDAPEED